MQDLKREFEYKTVNLIFGQLNAIEQLHGFRVNKLAIFRDEDFELDYELDAELLTNGRQI